MNETRRPARRPATNVTTRASRVAGVAADNSDSAQGRAAFMRLCAHLRRRHGRVYFHNEHRGIAA